MSAARTDHEWLSISQVAIELRVSAATVKRWIAAGELPVLQPRENGAVRIPVRALTARRREASDGR